LPGAIVNNPDIILADEPTGALDTETSVRVMAFLPPQAAVVLVLISMLPTLIAGVIPSRSAAKKDPVV
jgi:ABC-type ATPase involved in cell division